MLRDDRSPSAVRAAAVEGAALVLDATGALDLWRAAATRVDRWLKRLGVAEVLQRGSLVFMFHHLTRGEDPIRRGIDVALFDGFCRHLAEHHEVLPLVELERQRRAGSLTNAVALSFDDGYADNLELGLPVLRRYGLPATVFVATGAVGGGVPLWTSRLACLVDHGRVPEAEPLQVCGVAVELGSAEKNEATFVALAEALKQVDPGQREEEIARLKEALGVDSYGRLCDEMLTWDQIRECDAAGLTVGAHTVSHPILSQLDDRQLEQEVLGCKEELEAQLGRKVLSFAYPNGTAQDYDERCVALLRKAGFQAAYTTIFGANTARTPPYEQRRVTSYGQTVAHLALQTERFFYAAR